ncbi:MAG: hypothetical protein ACQEQD_08995 [Bacillota bacterium]
MKVIHGSLKSIFWIIILSIFILVIFSSSLLANDDYYAGIVLLTIRADDKIIEQDNFFQVIDYDQYVLIPLSALSRYLEIELDYKRDDEKLFVYYPEKDSIIVVDLQNNTYPDFPEWNDEAPLMVEGDFFVSKNLIEYLMDVDLKWSSLKQELTLNLDEFEEKSDVEENNIIKEKPVKKPLKPDVVGPNFSLGSIHYSSELHYRMSDLEELTNGNLESNNSLYLHGRAGDWALSLGQNLNYNFGTDNFSSKSPLIRALNRENDRLIVLGDASIDFDYTAGGQQTRGLYFQYPQLKLNKEKSYISVQGEAEEGSTVKLYINGIFIDERYIYKKENSYYFSLIQLNNNRTNQIKVVIENLNGEKKEIIKNISGSNYIFEKSTKEAVFVMGKSRESSEYEWENDIVGFQFNSALTGHDSLSWELAAQRESIDDEKIINLGSLFRIAHRTQRIPTVTNLDLLVGGEKDSLETGGSSRVMYTFPKGYFSTKVDYIPPEITDYVDVLAGGRAALNLQHEIANSWIANLNASTTRSIKDMSDLELYQGRLNLGYFDISGNSFSLGTEYSTRDQEVFWEQININEIGRESASLSLGAKRKLNDTNLKGSSNYQVNWINFGNDIDTAKSDKAELNLELTSKLKDNLIIGAKVESEANWFESNLQEQDLLFDGRLRYNFGNNFLTLSGFSGRTKNNISDDEFQENRREISLTARHFKPPGLSFMGELKNTYIYMLNEGYFSMGAGVNYNNSDKNWEIDLDLDYLAPLSIRENPQEKINLKFTKSFDSGLEAFISGSRDYKSFYQKEPSYSISVGLNQSLNFGQSKIFGQEYTGGRHSSYIGGIVYLDQEGTGVRNSGDPVLSDIGVFREGTKTVTDENGKFEFANVRPGLHEVGIDINSLDAKYDILTENKIVQVRDNENIFLEFGLTMSGSISGEVFLDRELTGSKDPKDENISMVGLKIPELDKTVYSDADGSFYFSDIPLGKYNLKVLTDTIPSGMKLAEDNVIEVDITKDTLDINDLDIRLIYKVE